MYRIDAQNSFYHLEPIFDMLIKNGINVIIDDQTNPETLYLTFPDVNPEFVIEKEPFEINDEETDFTFNWVNFSNFVPCAIFDHRDVGVDALNFLEKLQGVVKIFGYRLIDVNTNGDSYVYFLSKSIIDTAESHIKTMLRNHNSDTCIELKPAVIKGKMEIHEIKRIINHYLNDKNANLYILKDLLEDIKPDMQYTIIEDEDTGDSYIKEMPFSDD
jgi:hypothetical protein